MTRWEAQSVLLCESNGTQLIPSDKTAQSLHIRRAPKQSQSANKKNNNKMLTVSYSSGKIRICWEAFKDRAVFPYQYLSGCGAHHPASTTATPQIKIMSGLKLWLHPKESSGEQNACHVFPRQDYSSHEIHPSWTRVETFTHIFFLAAVLMTILSLWHLEGNKNNQTVLQMLQQQQQHQQQLDIAASHRLVRLCGTHAGLG